MSSTKVIISFGTSRYSDSGLLNKANYIVERMLGNPMYPAPTPTIEVLKDTVAGYEYALANTETKSKESIVLKNNSRKELENMLRQIAMYVQLVSKGDAILIMGAGFDTYKTPMPIGILEKPKSLTVRHGKNSGSVELISSVVPNARFYIFEYTLCPVTDESIWMSNVSTKRNLLIEGLESRREYVFRVAGGASVATRAWSDTISWNIG